MTIKELDNRIINLENMVSELLAIIKSGCFPVSVAAIAPPCRYTLHAWLDEWLTAFKASSVKPNTFASYQNTVRVHIKPNLPDMPLNLITGLELQRFLTSMPPSRTRKAVHDILKECFKTALGLKLVADNPALAVKIPMHEQEKGAALDTATLAAFKTAIKGHTLENLFLFLLYTGARRGEALTLNRSDIDYKNGLLHIRGTKTKGSQRTIPLFENVAALLNDLEPDKDGFYFPFRGDYPTHVFKKLCPKHKLHDLRHTFATTCLSAKIPLKVVQKWLGHSKLDTTADIYSHVTAEMNQNEAETLNRYINEKTAY